MHADTPDPTLPGDWRPVLALAVLWGVGPALPALWAGELLGQPWTDLYPSVWGLWWFAQGSPGDGILPLFTSLLNHPTGMGFYYSSPLKGLAAIPLLTVFSVPAAFNALTVLARMGTVLASAGAARAWGAGTAGMLLAAGAWGCSPFFHGYAVEGIVEGTDGWPLALWAWAAGRRRWGLSAVFVGLSVVASWYLGACALLLAGLAGLRDRRAWLGLLGVLPALPFVVAFGGAFSGGVPLDPSVRRAMGASLTIPRPGSFSGMHPFAMNTYVGWVLSAVLLAARPRLALWALIPAILSLGWGPWYSLPGLEMLRFPYRWHAATLAILALAAARSADRWRHGHVLGPLIVLESLLLGPAEPVIPGAPVEVPALVLAIDGPVVDVPGPVALPPGVHNPSRPRSRWVLYFQTVHGQPTPWRPDFNSVGVAAEPEPRLGPLLAYDRVAGGRGGPLDPGTVKGLETLGLRWILIHGEDPGLIDADALLEGLIGQGAEVVDHDSSHWLVRMPDNTSLHAVPQDPPVDPPEAAR